MEIHDLSCHSIILLGLAVSDLVRCVGSVVYLARRASAMATILLLSYFD